MIKIMDKIDLHIHSTYSSDGELEVLQVVGACVENRVNTFSITDHNSVRARKKCIFHGRSSYNLYGLYLYAPVRRIEAN